MQNADLTTTPKMPNLFQTEDQKEQYHKEKTFYKDLKKFKKTRDAKVSKLNDQETSHSDIVKADVEDFQWISKLTPHVYSSPAPNTPPFLIYDPTRVDYYKKNDVQWNIVDPGVGLFWIANFPLQKEQHFEICCNTVATKENLSSVVYQIIICSSDLQSDSQVKVTEENFLVIMSSTFVAPTQEIQKRNPELELFYQQKHTLEDLKTIKERTWKSFNSGEMKFQATNEMLQIIDIKIMDIMDKSNKSTTLSFPKEKQMNNLLTEQENKGIEPIWNSETGKLEIKQVQPTSIEKRLSNMKLTTSNPDFESYVKVCIPEQIKTTPVWLWSNSNLVQFLKDCEKTFHLEEDSVLYPKPSLYFINIERISGLGFSQLTETDLKEIGFSLGTRKALLSIISCL